VGALLTPAAATYEPRAPRSPVLYNGIAAQLETFLASLHDDPDAKGLPAYVERAFYAYLPCGILAHGVLRLGCETCEQEVLLAFRWKRRGFCPSGAGRPHGPDGGSPGGMRHALGADTPMGRLRADAVAFLDRALACSDRAGADDDPPHDRAV
jgi:hypothetical protein